MNEVYLLIDADFEILLGTIVILRTIKISHRLKAR